MPFLHWNEWEGSRATSASRRRRHTPAPKPKAAKAGPKQPKRLMDSSWSCTPLADGALSPARQHGSQQLEARTALRALLGLIYAHGALCDKSVNARGAHFFQEPDFPPPVGAHGVRQRQMRSEHREPSCIIVANGEGVRKASKYMDSMKALNASYGKQTGDACVAWPDAESGRFPVTGSRPWGGLDALAETRQCHNPDDVAFLQLIRSNIPAPQSSGREGHEVCSDGEESGTP